ncbi:MAG: GAF domain-containing protein [Bacteroidia bacterium]|jgi:L-methionine (R)-S-oxide reductase
MTSISQITAASYPSKSHYYDALFIQLQALIAHEHDAIIIMAQTAALLHFSNTWHWTGFYRVSKHELLLGPYQGPPACSRIAFGKGVCGTAWKEARTINVPDVNQFQGHIACSAFSQSELVIPIYNSQNCICAVLDIDSTETHAFDATDVAGIEKLCTLIRLDT